ncbi:hypothetical protein I3760_15G117100 [Carya illinoinensis]|nr:hypothetical protein I3760_15G117100 [Carya illinoinensis]
MERRRLTFNIIPSLTLRFPPTPIVFEISPPPSVLPLPNRDPFLRFPLPPFIFISQIDRPLPFPSFTPSPFHLPLPNRHGNPSPSSPKSTDHLPRSLSPSATCKHDFPHLCPLNLADLWFLQDSHENPNFPLEIAPEP